MHESNVVFLREKHHTSASHKHQEEKDEEEGEKEGDAIGSIDFSDMPLLAAGCVFCHSLLDSLMVQAVFNPDIVCFWEAVSDTGQKGLCSSSTDTQAGGWNRDRCSDWCDPLAVSTLASLRPMRMRSKLKTESKMQLKKSESISEVTLGKSDLKTHGEAEREGGGEGGSSGGGEEEGGGGSLALHVKDDTRASGDERGDSHCLHVFTYALV